MNFVFMKFELKVILILMFVCTQCNHGNGANAM